MKISCIFKQALCLMILFILTCDSKGPKGRTCSVGILVKEMKNLLNKTREFKKLFLDDITNMKFLSKALEKEFMENCSTRDHLLSFYADVLSADMVSTEAEKSGIKKAFLITEDILKICYSSKCQSTEETEGMKDLRSKSNKITLKEKLHKAISEMDELVMWINLFINKKRQ